MSEDNRCAFCNEPVGMAPAHECGPKNVGDECRCCGRVLLASSDAPVSEETEEAESEG